jgi:hypothetical protein
MCGAEGQGDLFVSVVHAAKLPETKLRTQHMTAYVVFTLYTQCMYVWVTPDIYKYIVYLWIRFYLTKICEYYYNIAHAYS